jgi:hypothetical protein
LQVSHAAGASGGGELLTSRRNAGGIAVSLKRSRAVREL